MGSPVLNAGRERRKRTFHQHLIAMARYIAALALLGAVLADGTGHSAPAASYGAPSYEEPSYAAPAASYGAPSYDTPSYDAPATGYTEPSAAGYESYDAPSYGAADTVDGFDLSKILDLLPLFIAVFAAIILAQLLAPLFAVLFDAKVGLLGGIINPFGQAKLDIINTVFLNPLGFAIGNFPPTTNAQWGKRSFSEDFNILSMIDTAGKIYDAFNQVEA